VFGAMARGPRKLTVLFGSASLTHDGGVYRLHRFFGRLHLKKLLTDETRLIQRHNRYSVGEMLRALLYPIILGLERIDSTSLLRQNGVFQYLTGLRSDPDATTLRRGLRRVALTALPKLRRLHDRFLSRMMTRPHPPRRLSFDIDSTVLVVYGKQEHARIGDNSINGDSALGAIPTRHCFANETYCHLLRLAYTLVTWFKRLCLPPEFQNATLQTLRHQILFMPAQLRRTDNRPHLVLPSSGMREAAWKYALNHIERLDL
jgi:hypothetical protein